MDSFPLLLIPLWLSGFWFLWRIPRLGTPDSPPAKVFLSVIIPARDEEETLPYLLGSLQNQTRPADEIIVVDDHSTDRTAQAARAYSCQVIRTEELPAGWLGKPWACDTGARAARGSHLLFLDADTRLEPEGIERLLGGLDRGRQVLSVQPFHQVTRPYEQLSAFFNIIQMGGMGIFSPLGTRLRPLGVFGPCILLTRAAYQAIDGHAGVCGEVLEDLRLGQRLHAAGTRLALYGGTGVISFRMYPRGLVQLIEGWTKNFSAGAAILKPEVWLLLVAWVFGCVFSVTFSLTHLLSQGSAGEVILAVLLYTAYASQIYWMLRRLGSFHPLTAVLYPAPLAFFILVFFTSFVLTYLLGVVRWKGRAIHTHRTR